jgi:hypothetical protein
MLKMFHSHNEDGKAEKMIYLSRNANTREDVARYFSRAKKLRKLKLSVAEQEKLLRGFENAFSNPSRAIDA